jgi:phosphoribosylformylglycinamidine synthase I
MSARKPIALVLRSAGTNCDAETVRALELAGARVDLIHVNRLTEEPQRLSDAELLAIPGGFTFGDDVESGAVLAHILRRRLEEPLLRFVADGKLVIGICNGFQILVRLGILPGGTGRAALLTNHSGRFEDRWVRLVSGPRSTPWFEAESEFFVPVAHAEGRFAWFPENEGEPFPESQIAFRYRGERSGSPGYPANPNGSHEAIAGVTNEAGNVLGLMPHPERFLIPEHHPTWMRYRRADGSPPDASDLPDPLGLEIYRRAVASLR